MSSLAVGDRIRAKYLATSKGARCPGNYFEGTIAKVHGAGETYDIKYDDGDTEEGVLAKYVRASESHRIIHSQGRRLFTRKAVEEPQVSQSARMLPREAIAAAEAEGLTLLRDDNSTGFWGVQYDKKGKKGKQFKAQYRKPGVDTPIYVGMFACAEEAALAVARHFPQAPSVVAEAKAKKEAEAARDVASAALTVEDVERIASEEGLTLLRDPTLSSARNGGWRGVSFQGQYPGKQRRPYQANWMGAGAKSKSNLGLFLTPHEAGLAIARALGPERSAAEAVTRRNASGWTLHDDHELSAEDAKRLAKEEGLTLRRKHNSSDYWCTHEGKREGTPRWHAQLNAGTQHGGYAHNGILHLGAFACPEAAALAIARRLRDQPELEARAQMLQQAAKARAERARASSAPKKKKRKRKRKAQWEEDSESEGDWESEGDCDSEGDYNYGGEGEGDGDGEGSTGGDASSGGSGAGGTEPLDAEVLEVEAFEMWSDDEDEQVPEVTSVAVTW